jgi:S-adenosylmethionine:tRNA ribosyltransferase-isomerase
MLQNEKESSIINYYNEIFLELTMIQNEMTPTDLTKQDFDYFLPQERIAQTPIEPRDHSRLMVVDRQSGSVIHRHFYDVLDYLEEGDVLVVNESRVIPARMYGVKEETQIEMECVMLRQHEQDTWEVLLRPGRRAKVGTHIVFGNGLLRAEVKEVLPDGNRILAFTYDASDIYAVLDQIGQMPLPPYITEKLEDKERYQTVYSKEKGSAAAPTAGLHFTEELLQKIREKGVEIAPVLLHVGLGTFRPVKEDRIIDHKMHTEWFSLSEETAEKINNRRGRLIAVGTTSCRVLESVADENGRVRAMSGDTGIFIYPGYKFRAVEALITNFHLPQSTLLMLVSAFTSRKIMLSAYQTAVEEGYRFFSFGDAMLIQ